jgi:antitoxin component of RelBE/YafQ-DinJ toxin-antitoxin module
MTTSLYIDEETKQKASLKAKKDQLSFSAVVRILLSDYAKGKIEIGAKSVTHYEISEIPVDNETQKKMDSIVTKWHHKK